MMDSDRKTTRCLAFADLFVDLDIPDRKYGGFFVEK
jgi:hypothetical protein